MSSQPSDTLLFDVDPLDKAVADIVPEANAPGKWCAFHAIRHLNQAWKIKDIDPEMAAFRCLTAEEESATALIHALKFRRYEGSDKINHQNHIHKNAVTVFVNQIIREFIISIPSPLISATSLFVENDSKRLRTNIRVSMGEGLPFANAQPIPPLEFEVKEKFGDGVSKLIDLSHYHDKLVNEQNCKSIIDYLRERANFRNQILYAANAGYPRLDGNIENNFRYYKQAVFMNLKVFLLIDQYKEKQSFVQFMLNGFLQMLNLIPQSVQLVW